MQVAFTLICRQFSNQMARHFVTSSQSSLLFLVKVGQLSHIPCLLKWHLITLLLFPECMSVHDQELPRGGEWGQGALQYSGFQREERCKDISSSF